MKTLYDVLGIKSDADLKEIKRAYFVKAKEYHPDSGDRAEVGKFYEVTEAYKKLSNREQRRAYDLSLGDTDNPSPAVPAPSAAAESAPSYSRSTHGQDTAFRQKEMERYRRQMFFQAATKVAISFLVGGVIGNTLFVILGGQRFMAITAGALFGFFWSMNNHFDIETFIHDITSQKIALWGGRALMAGSALYFIVLFAAGLFQAL